MALKGRSASKALGGIKQMKQGVKPPAVEENTNRQKQRNKELPSTAMDAADVSQAHLGDIRKTKAFETINIHGSKGEKYQVVVPASYVKGVPSVWEWNAERYKVAELIAQGIPFSQIPDHPGVEIKSRMTIYCWLEHPEFKNHVDGLVMETGWANRRERLTNMARLNDVLFNKVVREIDRVALTDKMAGALLSAISANAKFIAQEKGEFVEESKVTQDTTLTGTVGVATVNVDSFLKSKASEEREELEKEFAGLGDDIIRTLTGGRD